MSDNAARSDQNPNEMNPSSDARDREQMYLSSFGQIPKFQDIPLEWPGYSTFQTWIAKQAEYWSHPGALDKSGAFIVQFKLYQQYDDVPSACITFDDMVAAMGELDRLKGNNPEEYAELSRKLIWSAIHFGRALHFMEINYFDENMRQSLERLHKSNLSKKSPSYMRSIVRAVERVRNSETAHSIEEACDRIEEGFDSDNPRPSGFEGQISPTTYHTYKKRLSGSKKK